MGWAPSILRAILAATALLLAVVVAPSARAAGSAGVVGTPIATCIAPATGQSIGTLLAHPAAFDCNTGQSRFGSGDFWVRSGPLPLAAGDARTRVRIASMWMEHVTLHAVYPGGRVDSYPLDQQGLSRHLQLGGIIEWVLPQRRAPPERLVWHVRGAANLRGVIVSPTLATPEQSAASNLTIGALYAAFGGLCLALLVYNLAMWAALRHGFQLAYCAMILALAAYAFSSSGALAWFDPQVAQLDRLRMNYALLALAGTSTLLFARTFFEPSVCRGWVARAMAATACLLLVSATAFVVLTPWRIATLNTLHSLSFIALLLVAVPIVVRARRQRSPHLWLFALAWAVPIAFACIRILCTLDLLPWNFWLDNSTMLAMSFEALVSTLAIAYRIRLLIVERDEARAKEVAARMLADTDPLTGLLNRRAFLGRAIGLPGEQMLLLADLDHFKRINDTLGHHGGDEVLRMVARTLTAAMPADALVARIGGEEFAIVVASGAAVRPDSILARLRAAPMPFDIAVTASIGSATGPLAGEDDWTRLYQSADHALFAAKNAGRDRCRFAVPTRVAA